MEQILSRENMMKAYKKVKAKKGAAGVDGISTEDIKAYLVENWERIKEEILERKYTPQPVLRVEIPKPDGTMRKLGIPSVMDPSHRTSDCSGHNTYSGTALQRV